MSVDGLSINFPPRRPLTQYLETPINPPRESKIRYGDIPKILIPSDSTISYSSQNGRWSNNVHYYRQGGITHLEEGFLERSDGGLMTKSQELNQTDPKLSIKKNKVSSYGKEEYSSTHILNHETGLESVARKKGREVIGGYEILPAKGRTFAQGFKGRLQKLGMAVATDANGCERPVLNRLGAVILKVAKMVK